MPTVTAICPSSGTPRFTSFELSMYSLDLPPGSQFVRPESAKIAYNINRAIRDSKITDYYWLIGDDHTFEDDIVLRLMRVDVPVVVALTVMRYPPFLPVVYGNDIRKEDDGSVKYNQMTWDILDGCPRLFSFPGMLVGTAGMLLRREIFDKIPYPWFRESIAEDLDFCQRIYDYGFNIQIDTETTMGHTAPCTVRPIKNQETGRWDIELKWPNGHTSRLGRAS